MVCGSVNIPTSRAKGAIESKSRFLALLGMTNAGGAYNEGYFEVSVAKKKAKSTHAIADKKKRGEWVELRFMASAAERGLPASKPFGDSENFDVVVGRPGKFVAVQVKCTVFPSKNGEGFICSACSSHNIYKPGAFDFLAAFVVPKETWYILPAGEIRGMRSGTFCVPSGKYEKYREAWELLREAVGEMEGAAGADAENSSSFSSKEPPVKELGQGEIHSGGALGRMEGAFAYMRRRLEGGRG
jgi:hypothetical protein